MGIAVKLTLEGINQVWYPETWFFVMVAAICVVTQMIYLNKVLVLVVSCPAVHFLVNTNSMFVFVLGRRWTHLTQQ